MGSDSVPEISFVRFSLSGPIRTGVIHDTRRLIADESGEILSKLDCLLKPLGCGWEVYVRNDQLLEISVDTRRESMVKLPYLAMFSFSQKEILSVEEKILAKQKAHPSYSLLDGVHLASLQIRFFSFGYAIFCADFYMWLQEQHPSLKTIRKGVEAFSREEIVELFKDIFAEKIREFQEASESIRFDDVLPVVETAEKQLEQNKDTNIGLGLPRWVHRVYGLQFKDKITFDNWSNRIEELIFTASGADLKDLHPRDGTSVFVASGNSALLSTDSDSNIAWSNLREMVEFQNAFFARAEDLDERLMRLVNKISLDKERARSDRSLMKEMDSYAVDIVDSREEFLIFKNDVEDYHGHLDPDAKKIWTGLWHQWETGKKFDQIEEQVDIMGGLYDRIITLLNQDQAKRLSSFALAFTLIAGLSALVDSLTFMQMKTISLSTFVTTNTTIIISVVLILAYIFWRIMKR